MFRKDDLSVLLANTAKPAVTILMPGIRAGQETQQNPIRFDNLAQEAHARLIEMGLRPDDAEAILKPARELGEQADFWNHADHGMAFFMAPGFFRWFAVPTQLPEEARVGNLFHFTPLLPLLNHDGRYVLITASAAQIGVFDAGRHWIRERTGLDLPQGVEEINRESDFQPQYHSAPQARPRSNRPSGMPARQGTNDAEEQRHANNIEYLRRAAAVLEKEFSGEPVPIVLAAQPNIQGHFRNLLGLKQLLSEGLTLNPDAMSPEELNVKALPLVEPIWRADEERAREKFATIYGEEGEGGTKVTTKPEEIIRAAQYGQVECLFLANDRSLWGRYDPATEKLVAHGRQGVEDDDLADLAAAQTLLHAGQVEVTDKDHLPAGQVMAALLRY
ncbi:hypothetical protein [Telmatospirillum sp. J64-1]|uniref:baeRF3 domain-containing protein n=1 Tax=Telmatospirillum sp. J64-1 TaxID=2502183 RepID=UPI00115F13A1|nr:hypothetical protein [Telmatospirillum sp. J64-1]